MSLTIQMSCCRSWGLLLEVIDLPLTVIKLRNLQVIFSNAGFANTLLVWQTTACCSSYRLV